MRLALVRPRYHTHLITPQLGLGYLASAARYGGHEVALHDGLADGLDTRALVDRCRDADLVGIGVMSDTLPAVSELSRALVAAGKTVVVGGPQVTALPEPSLRATGAQLAVVGEGERSLVALLDAWPEPGALPGVHRAGEGMAEARALEPDLDALPFPAWDLMPPARYQYAPHGAFVARMPVAPITTSRGCPCACSFCASPGLWGGGIRFRSPENVLDEIELLVLRHGVREIHFEDDNLTLRRAHVAAICEGLLERGLDISWACPNGVRVDTLDPALLALMKRSGCSLLAFGVESGDPEILRRVGKGTSLEAIEAAIGMAADAGIDTQGFFIFGLPGETDASIERSIRFACDSRLDRAQFLLLDVLPGSRLYGELAAAHPSTGATRSFQQLTWCPPGLDPDLLASTPSRAFRRFFLRRPRRLAKLLRRARPRQIAFVLRRVRDFGIL
jgi:anaerobic magnesium-protoporphyrin IX monomethyl ester cyclase